MKIAQSILFLLLFINIAVFSQEYNYELLTVEEGLSQSSVTCITQDEKGFIWIGTRDGLNRYDGYEIKVFRKKAFDTTSLSSNNIVCLLAEESLGLWVGTANGLHWFDAKTQKFKKIDFKKDEEPIIPKTIFQDKFGGIWVGTNYGFHSIERDIEGKEFIVRSYGNIKKNVEKRSNYGVNGFLHDKQNNFWVATTQGLFRFHFDENNALDIDEESRSFPKEHQISRDRFSSIYEHSDGSILVTVSKKIYRYDRQNNGFVDFFEIDKNHISPILALKKNQEGQLIAGTSSGLYLISIEGGEIVSSQFTELPELGMSQISHKINFILPDNIYNEFYWLATDIGGVVKMYQRSKPFQTFFIHDVPNLKISNPYLRHVVADEERIWLNFGLGILVYERSKEHFKFFNDIVPKNNKSRVEIAFLKKKKDGKILGGLTNAFVEIWVDEKGTIQTNKRPFKQFCINRATAIEETLNHYILGDNIGGISILDKAKFNEINCFELGDTSQVPVNTETSSLLMDTQSNLWVGTFKGLFVYPNFKPDVQKIPTAQFFTYNPSDSTSLIGNRVTHLMEDSKNNIWVCTRNGLMKATISGQNIQLHAVKIEELEGQVIYGILENKSTGELWMSTNSGLFRYNPNSEKVDNFNVKDGLQSNEFNTASFFQSDDGRLYFGGPKGVTNFSPEEIYLNTQPPLTWFTELKIINEEPINLLTFDKTQSFLLDYNQRSFSVNFIGIDFFRPDELNYFYDLEGTTNVHHAPLGNSKQVNFSQLEPGDYTLYITATNKDGASFPKGDSLQFTIRAPFWKMMWFYLLVTGVVIGLFWLAFFIRYRNKMNKLAAIEEVRKNISEDFHDELGSKLSIISMYSEFTKQELKDSENKAAIYLDKVSTTAARLYENTRDLIWALNPQNDTLNDLYLQMKDFGEELFQDTNIDFHATGMPEGLKAENLPMRNKRHLLLIFKEAMHNALKHSNCNNVNLNIEPKEQKLIFSLQDDGIGFDVVEVYKGDGLKNMQHRANQINGELHFESEKGNTRIWLEIKA